MKKVNDEDGKEGSAMDEKRYWERTGDDSSHRLMIMFVLVIIGMLIILIVMGGYGYAKLQEWKERPRIQVEEGLFKFHHNRSVGEKVNITVYLTLENKGEEDADGLTLEWIIMNRSKQYNNIFIDREERSIDPIPKDTESEVTFNLTLPKGYYTIAYRTYEHGYFSYEGRQSFEVTEEDLPEQLDGADSEKTGADDSPALSTGLFLIVIFIYAIYRRKQDE